MSKQFRMFLTPPDIEEFIVRLQSKVEFTIIQPKSRTMTPVVATSPFSEYTSKTDNRLHKCVRCFLAPSMQAEIKMGYISERYGWHVDVASEAVEFSGCDFDGSSLRVGRFYFQTDQMVAHNIFPKRPEFIRWADRLFRAGKKILTRSEDLMAYVGKNAAAFEQKGGRFINW